MSTPVQKNVKMGRKAKFNREEALDFSMNQIWTHGFATISVKTLSEQLGITRSSFYNAFGSMDDLFREAIDRYFAATPDNGWKNLPEGAEILPIITSVIRRAVHVLTKNTPRGCMEANCIAALVGTHETLGDYLIQAIIVRVQYIEHLLEIAQKNQELPPDTDIHALALAIQSHILGISLLSKIVTDEDELWSSAELTLRGLGIYNDPPQIS